MTDSDAPLSELQAALGRRYRLERELGRGGMGTVYLAHDLELDRPVALKVLPREFAMVPELRERFLRETRTAASFSHPNIVPVFSIEEHEGLLAFAMGFVEGESLSQRVQRSGTLSVRELVRMLQDVGYALAYAHGRGVVHRDIKPDNIMIERATGRALLMDFGISRTITTQVATPGLTRVGEVVGTPEFMSPEQAAGDTISGRSDLYSLGLAAWFAATGRLAISGESTQKIIVRQITEVIPPIGAERADLPPALADAIDRCLRKDPDERFESADALVEVLDASRIAAPDTPLAIRLFAEEAATSGLVLLGGIAMGVLLYIALGTVYQGNLDIILPVVLFAAMIWGRVAQTGAAARRLAQRGFSVGEIQRGLASILAEHDADRAQLRADRTIMARRRRQVAILLVLFTLSFVTSWYALTYQRFQVKPHFYMVTRPGSIMLYAAYVTRGISLVGLVRSPLRRPIGEWLFRWTWLGRFGARILRGSARGLPQGVGVTRPGVTVDADLRAPSSATSSRPVMAPSASTVAPGHAPSTRDTVDERIDALERRVAALEHRDAPAWPVEG